MNAPVTVTELMASKSLRLTLRGNEFEVIESAPRFMRIEGLLCNWSLDMTSDRNFLHSQEASLYVGFRLTDQEARAIREKFALLGLRVDSPHPAPTSSSAGHEATAADLPNNSGSGATPPVQGNAGGSLEGVS